MSDGKRGRVVFDLDGTLIDSAPDIRAIANRVLAGEGAAPISLAETHEFIGNGVGVFVTKMRAARDLPEAVHERLLAAFLELYDGAVELTRTYPGVREALEALGRDHRLGICTNKPIRPCRLVLDHLGLAHHFDSVLGGDSLPLRKPDPAPLFATLEGLGDGPAIYVGDSGVDAETARRAGLPFLLYTEGYRKGPVAEMPHTRAFSDWSVLPGLVADCLAGA